MTNTTAASTPPPLAPGDPRLPFARAVALATGVIAGVTPDQLHNPTPCPEMDVQAMLGHLVMVLQRVACAGRDEDPATWPMGFGPVADDAWVAAWQEAAHDVQAAWTDETKLARPTRLPWGAFPGAAALGAYVNEVTVHTWDLARATGQSPDWDEQVVAVAYAVIQQAMPAEGRDEIIAEALKGAPPGFKPPFGAAVDVPADAPLIDRLVAWTGRRP
jgi:uncharacterized protein (TIGR03086 family)